MGWVTIGRGRKKRHIYINDGSTVNHHNSSTTNTPLHSRIVFNYPDEDELQKFVEERSKQFEESKKQEIQKLQVQKIELEKERKRLEELRKVKEEKKESKIRNLKTVAQTSISVISTTDPHLAGAYLTYRFAKYGYQFIKKLREEYQITGKWDEALLNVVSTEIRDKVSALLKNNYVQKVLEIITNDLYSKYSRNDYVRIYPEYENAIKLTMVKSLDSFIFGNKLDSTTIETEFKKATLEVYFNKLLETYAENNNIRYPSPEWSNLKEKLSEKIFHEFDEGAIVPLLVVEGKFDGKSWLENNIPSLLELT